MRKTMSKVHDDNELDCSVETEDSKPTVFVVILGEGREYDNKDDIRDEIEADWKRIWRGKPPAPIFVLPPGSRFGTV